MQTEPSLFDDDFNVFGNFRFTEEPTTIEREPTTIESEPTTKSTMTTENYLTTALEPTATRKLKTFNMRMQLEFDMTTTIPTTTTTTTSQTNSTEELENKLREFLIGLMEFRMR